MGPRPTFGFLSLLVLLSAAMMDHVASSPTGHNLVFHSTAEDELSTAALNVRLSFQPYEEEWSSFKKSFGRQYRQEAEERQRYQTFLDNVQIIEQHNARFRDGNSTFWMGINQFADMTLEEYRAYVGQLSPVNASEDVGRLRCSIYAPPHVDSALNRDFSVDWRRRGYVTRVKNQGRCGSCYAFSATGALEGQHFRKTGRLVPLSEQQLVDCSRGFGNYGCNGGYPHNGYAYVYSAGGISSEADYRYVGQVRRCRFYRREAVAKVRGCKIIRAGNENHMRSSVQTQGPVAVLMDASRGSFRFYRGGIYQDPRCARALRRMTHAVLAVGYGTWRNRDYWIIKNSWGGRWGNQGYFFMARNKGNMCGIATQATFPLM